LSGTIGKHGEPVIVAHSTSSIENKVKVGRATSREASRMPRGGVGIGGHMKGEQRGRRPLRLHEGAVEERREWGSRPP